MNTIPKILAVDDKRENLVAIQTVLKDMPVEVITANSGNEALKLTMHHDFVLALLDIHMPEMDGFELSEILRSEEKTAHLPFIFISAVYTDNFNVFKGYEKGAFSFITKPFQPEILINKVQFFVDKHKQELDLYNLNKELEAFSYSVSHDLRAPLRAAAGFSEILKEKGYQNLDDETKQLLDKIIISIDRMEHLINDLLKFSRAGQQQLTKTTVDMNELLNSVIKSMETSPLEKITFHINSLKSTYGDKAMLRQVIFNLLSNAIKYSAKKDKQIIEIGSKEEKGSIIYYIKDNGAGFNMKYYDKLFKVFQRLHGPNQFEGTGVGLAIVQRIVAKHGGKVWAESKVDEGSTFYFSMPAN